MADPKSPRDPSFEGTYEYKRFAGSKPVSNKNGLYLFYSEDNEKCLERIIRFGGVGAIAGSYVGITNILANSTSNSALVALGRLTARTGVGAFAGASYVGAVCTSSKLRGGKTDGLNHFAGGMMLGSIVGMLLRSQRAGTLWGLGFGVVALLCKSFAMEGWEVFPTQYHRPMGFEHHRTRDYRDRV